MTEAKHVRHSDCRWAASNNIMTLFMVLSSWQSLREFSRLVWWMWHSAKHQPLNLRARRGPWVLRPYAALVYTRHHHLL